MSNARRNGPPTSGRRSKPFRLTLAAALLALGVPLVAAERPVLEEPAQRQIAALMAEKASRTPAQSKISSRLLYASRRQQGDEAFFAALPELRTAVDLDEEGRTLVDLRAAVSENLLVYIAELGGEIANSVARYDAVRAWLPLERLEALAQRDDVRFIGPAERYLLNMNTSEGDVAHAADQARALFAVDGSGVQVGVLSDSVDSLAALQGSGDLPPAVTVLPGQSGNPGTSEGTAMLEIVFDLAAGADLLFATATPTQAQFATNITDLAAAGADVIVDDIFYFAEAAFQDGIVAQAVNAFTAAGGLFFSAAGNSGNLNDGTSGVWEGDFSPGPTPAGLAAACGMGPCATADFGGGVSLNQITVDSPSFFTLRWSDPLGGSGNDYDLYLLNGAGTAIVAASTNVQDGNDDPFEAITSIGFNDQGRTLAVVKASGADRCFNLSANRGQLSLATAGQTTGHSTAADGFGVAAVDVADAGGGVFTGGASNPVESFSSDGPRRIVLDAAGNAITPGDFSCAGGVVRDQPIITAADGVMTATPGFDQFFGTSAAAPHAAAIAALMKSAADLSPNGVRDVFAATALDIEAPGLDRDSGFGLLDALKAVGAVSTSGSCSCGLPAQACPGGAVLDGKPNNPATPGTTNAQVRACDTLEVGAGDFSNFDGAASTLIFSDGFESGDVSSWSNQVP